MRLAHHLKYILLTIVVVFAVRIFAVSTSPVKKEQVQKTKDSNLLHKLYAKKQNKLPTLVRKHRKKSVKEEMARIAKLDFTQISVGFDFVSVVIKQPNACFTQYLQPMRGPPLA